MTVQVKKHILKNLIANLILKEKIKTTKARAKAVQGLVDRLINLAKRGNSGRRQIGRMVTDKKAFQKIDEELAQRFSTRTGGFTRIIKLSPRAGDTASMAQIEFIEGEKIEKGAKDSAKKEGANRKTKSTEQKTKRSTTTQTRGRKARKTKA